MAKTVPHLLSSLFLVFLVFVVVGGGGGGGVSVGALFALLVCKVLVQKASAFQVFYKFQNTIRYNKRAL